MDPEEQEYGCHHVAEDTKDDDSLIERCWEEQYRGDSRKWLIRDASFGKPRGSVCSTMKSAYTFPREEHPVVNMHGQRRAILLQKFHDEATAEIIREQNDPPPVEEYCTEYDGNYNIPGFQPKDQIYTENTELFEKYPLYSSNATTFYSFSVANKVQLPGLTKTVDPKQPFKKNSNFSRPLSEELDCASK